VRAVRNSLAFITAFLLTLWAGSALAITGPSVNQTTCPSGYDKVTVSSQQAAKYPGPGGATGWFVNESTNAAAACSAGQPLYEAYRRPLSCVGGSAECQNFSGAIVSGVCKQSYQRRIKYANGNWSTWTNYGENTPLTYQNSTTSICVVQSTCNTAYVDTKLASIIPSGQEFEPQVCDPSSSCKANIDISTRVCVEGGNCGTLYKVVNEYCTVGSYVVGGNQAPAPENATAPAPEENCVSKPGLEYCIGQTGSQCGYVNDQYLCLSKTASDACQTLGDGSRVCGPAAKPPAAPDNGVSPATPATPDGTIERNTAAGAPVTYNFYNSTTVAAATRPPTTDGSMPDQGTDTNGDGFTSPEEAADGEQPCTGSACLVGPANGTPQTYAERTQLFINRLKAAPIVDAVASIGGSVPSGSCPTFSFQLFGGTLVLSPGCDILDQLITLLTVVSIAGWSLVGVRIVLEA